MTITGIRVVAPSMVQVNEEFSLGVKVLCEPYPVGAACYERLPAVIGRFNQSPRGIMYMDNVPKEWRGTVGIDGGDGYSGPTSFSFATGAGPYGDDPRPIRRIPGIRFTTPGIKFIRLTDPNSGLVGIANPIEVTASAPAERLYWGDLHSQTFFSDGLRCPEELYSFARDEAFLNIFALADHSESLTDRQWDYFVAVTNDFNTPDQFATLIGFEWTSRKWGHRNVYYPTDAGPIWRCTDSVMGDLPNLYQAAREHRALLIPHHSANAEMGVDWTLGHDPEVERLVEIYSVWGNSERPAAQGNSRPIRAHGGEKSGQHVVDALQRDYRFGFVGGGDIHDGRPGDDLHALQESPSGYRLLWPQGIMAVRAPRLTRAAIFHALWNRRSYATSNIRPLVRFELDGAPMGSFVQARSPLRFFVRVISEKALAAVTLVKDGNDYRSLPAGGCVVEETFTEKADRRPATYYVRIQRSDGEMGWSSPIWLEE